jgi:hypothetical protein
MRKSRAILLLLLSLPHLTCNQAIMTAPAGSTITLFANPTFISASGGVAVISALVIEPAGTPVVDGTVVQFFTSLGRIPEQGKTNDGVVRVNLVSDSRSGTAVVTAVSGGPAAPAPVPTGSPSPGPGTGSGSSSANVNVIIGNTNAARVFVVANPSRITISNSTHVTATVVDEAGNPVANVPVIFEVTDDPSTEFMDSQGRPIFTDNNGQAEDVMRTRRETAGIAIVRATVPLPGEIFDEVQIPIL